MREQGPNHMIQNSAMKNKITFLTVAVTLALLAGIAPRAFSQTYDSVHATGVVLAGNGTDTKHTLSISAATPAAGSFTLTFPGTEPGGVVGYVLTMNTTTGGLSWTNPASGLTVNLSGDVGGTSLATVIENTAGTDIVGALNNYGSGTGQVAVGSLDANVLNINSTLTVSSNKLGINLANSNTWTAKQTINTPASGAGSGTPLTLSNAATPGSGVNDITGDSWYVTNTGQASFTGGILTPSGGGLNNSGSNPTTNIDNSATGGTNNIGNSTSTTNVYGNTNINSPASAPAANTSIDATAGTGGVVTIGNNGSAGSPGDSSTTYLAGAVSFTGTVTLPSGSVTAGSIGLTNQYMLVGNTSNVATPLAPSANSVLITNAASPIGTPQWSQTLPSGLTYPAAQITGAGNIGGSTVINTTGSIQTTGTLRTTGTTDISTTGTNPINIGDTSGAMNINIGNNTGPSVTTLAGTVNFTGTVTLPAGSLSSSSLGLAKNDIFIGDATSATADTAMMTQDVTLQNTSTHVAQATVNGSHATTFAVANAMTVGGDATFNGAGTGLTVTNASTLTGAVTATNASNNIAGAFNGTVGATTPGTGAFTTLTSNTSFNNTGTLRTTGGATDIDVTGTNPINIGDTSGAMNINIGNNTGPSNTTVAGTVNFTGTVTLPAGTTATNFSGNLAGDVTGPQGTTAVKKINGSPLGSMASVADANMLIYNSSTPAWNPVAMSGDATITDAGLITIGANKVTYAKMQSETHTTLLGNPTASTNQVPEEITLGSGLSFTGTVLNTTNSGSVTSVGMTVPTFLSVSPATITSSGTFGVTLSGTALPVANGGTGQTSYTNGQLLIGNTTGNTLSLGTLTSGTGISITNGAGSITVNATSVPNSALANSSITVTGGTGLGVSGSPVSLGGTVTLSNTGVTSAVAGTGISLSGGTGAVTINASAVPNSALANPSLTVTAGSGLAGGGSVALGGTTTLTLDVTHANTWTGTQTLPTTAAQAAALVSSVNSSTANKTLNADVLNYDATLQVGTVAAHELGINLTNANTWTGTQTFGGAALTSNSPTQLTSGSSTNAWALSTTNSYFKISAGGPSGATVNGITGGADGRVMILVNTGSYNITFNSDAGTAGDVIHLVGGSGNSLILAPDGILTLIYDSTYNTTGGWRVVSSK